MTATPAPAPDGQALEARCVVLTAEERALMREAAAVDAVDPYGNDGVAMCKAVEGIIATRVAAAVERAVGEALEAAAKDLPGWNNGIRTHGDAARWLRNRARVVREGGNR